MVWTTAASYVIYEVHQQQQQQNQVITGYQAEAQTKQYDDYSMAVPPALEILFTLFITFLSCLSDDVRITIPLHNLAAVEKKVGNFHFEY